MVIAEAEALNLDDLQYTTSSRRPAGVGVFVQRVYELLADHPEGLSREQLYESVRDGWLATDVYRRYDHKRTRKSPEYGSPAFKQRAQRWYISDRLRSMVKSGFAEFDGQRYFVGNRIPKIAVICPARHVRHLVPLDANAREAHRSENEAFVRREQVKSDLMKGLNDRTITGKPRKLLQLAFDYLSGRAR